MYGERSQKTEKLDCKIVKQWMLKNFQTFANGPQPKKKEQKKQKNEKKRTDDKMNR